MHVSEDRSVNCICDGCKGIRDGIRMTEPREVKKGELGDVGKSVRRDVYTVYYGHKPASSPSSAQIIVI